MVYICKFLGDTRWREAANIVEDQLCCWSDDEQMTLGSGSACLPEMLETRADGPGPEPARFRRVLAFCSAIHVWPEEEEPAHEP